MTLTNHVFILRQKFLAWRLSAAYRFKHWIFQWKTDNEGDIAFVIFNRLSFTKYKEHTIIRFDGHKMEQAGNWQGCKG